MKQQIRELKKLIKDLDTRIMPWEEESLVRNTGVSSPEVKAIWANAQAKYMVRILELLDKVEVLEKI